MPLNSNRLNQYLSEDQGLQNLIGEPYSVSNIASSSKFLSNTSNPFSQHEIPATIPFPSQTSFKHVDFFQPGPQASENDYYGTHREENSERNGFRRREDGNYGAFRNCDGYGNIDEKETSETSALDMAYSGIYPPKATLSSSAVSIASFSPSMASFSSSSSVTSSLPNNDPYAIPNSSLYFNASDISNVSAFPSLQYPLLSNAHAFSKLPSAHNSTSAPLTTASPSTFISPAFSNASKTVSNSPSLESYTFFPVSSSSSNTTHLPLVSPHTYLHNKSSSFAHYHSQQNAPFSDAFLYENPNLSKITCENFNPCSPPHVEAGDNIRVHSGENGTMPFKWPQTEPEIDAERVPHAHPIDGKYFELETAPLAFQDREVTPCASTVSVSTASPSDCGSPGTARMARSPSPISLLVDPVSANPRSMHASPFTSIQQVLGAAHDRGVRKDSTTSFASALLSAPPALPTHQQHNAALAAVQSPVEAMTRTSMGCLGSINPANKRMPILQGAVPPQPYLFPVLFSSPQLEQSSQHAIAPTLLLPSGKSPGIMGTSTAYSCYASPWMAPTDRSGRAGFPVAFQTSTSASQLSQDPDPRGMREKSFSAFCMSSALSNTGPTSFPPPPPLPPPPLSSCTSAESVSQLMPSHLPAVPVPPDLPLEYTLASRPHVPFPTYASSIGSSNEVHAPSASSAASIASNSTLDLGFIPASAFSQDGISPTFSWASDLASASHHRQHAPLDAGVLDSKSQENFSLYPVFPDPGPFAQIDSKPVSNPGTPSYAASATNKSLSIPPTLLPSPHSHPHAHPPPYPFPVTPTSFHSTESLLSPSQYLMPTSFHPSPMNGATTSPNLNSSAATPGTCSMGHKLVHFCSALSASTHSIGSAELPALPLQAYAPIATSPRTSSCLAAASDKRISSPSFQRLQEAPPATGKKKKPLPHASLLPLAAPQSKKRFKIPRPENSFFLYRRTVYATVVEQHPGKTNPEISKIISAMWKSEPEDTKAYYRHLAIDTKRAHLQKYPDYKYRPRKHPVKKFVGMPPACSLVSYGVDDVHASAMDVN